MDGVSEEKIMMMNRDERCCWRLWWRVAVWRDERTQLEFLHFNHPPPHPAVVFPTQDAKIPKEISSLTRATLSSSVTITNRIQSSSPHTFGAQLTATKKIVKISKRLIANSKEELPVTSESSLPDNHCISTGLWHEIIIIMITLMKQLMTRTIGTSHWLKLNFFYVSLLLIATFCLLFDVAEGKGGATKGAAGGGFTSGEFHEFWHNCSVLN